MNTFNQDPNFSIVLPGGCNANCSFCFNKNQASVKPASLDFYIARLQTYLSSVGDQFYQISLTGGEPLLSPWIIPVLRTISEYRYQYTNILLTTNGTNLLSDGIPEIMKNSVDHINISRHHYDEKINAAIFSGSYNVKDEDLLKIISVYDSIGIDVSANCVINDKTSKDFIDKYIEWGKSMGFHAIRFRKENGSLDLTPVEKMFDYIKVESLGKCPVCRTKLQIINDMPVYWKCSVLEPSETIKDELYEIVYLADGNIYADWMAKKPAYIKYIHKSKLEKEKKEYKKEKHPDDPYIGYRGHYNTCGLFIADTDSCGLPVRENKIKGYWGTHC